MNNLSSEKREQILNRARNYEFYQVRDFVRTIKTTSKWESELNEGHLADEFLFVCFEEAHDRKFPQVIRKKILEMLHKDY